MRLGCLGCLALLIAVLSTAAALRLGIQAIREPDVTGVATTPEDGRRAQQKIFQIMRRGAHGGEKDGHSIVLSERELDAFLSRHLAEVAEQPLSDIGLRLPGDGIVEFRARLPIGHLMTETPLSAVADVLPASWLERRVWLRVGARPQLEAGGRLHERRHLRFEVTEFSVGRQRLPAILLRVLVDPRTLGLLRWPVPDGIDTVTVEAGRVVVRVAS
jgi:hypothetical protein